MKNFFEKPFLVLRLFVTLVVLVITAQVVLLQASHAQTPQEQAVLDALNWARQHPDEVAKYIEEKLIPLFDQPNPLQRRRTFEEVRAKRPDITEDDYKSTLFLMNTNEGAKAAHEAIAFLKKQAPLPSLKWNDALAKTATELAALQAKTGKTGHDRVGEKSIISLAKSLGSELSCTGENCAYGPTDPKLVVITLIVDDGVPSRGHRTNIYKNFNRVGIALGEHPKYKYSCVMDFGCEEEASPAESNASASKIKEIIKDMKQVAQPSSEKTTKAE